MSKQQFLLGRVLAAMGKITADPDSAKELWERYPPYDMDAISKDVFGREPVHGGSYTVPQEILDDPLFKEKFLAFCESPPPDGQTFHEWWAQHQHKGLA